MSCPSCGAATAGSTERCPGCGALLAPPTEGALAPDPAARPQPLREIPGLKKKERTWKDEVRERVHDRKRRRSGEPELPLFREPLDADAGEPARRMELGPQESAAAFEAEPVALREELEPDLPLRAAASAPTVSTTLAELRIAAAPEPAPAARVELPEPPLEPMARPRAVERPSPAAQWSLGAETTPEPPPVERPAYSGERARAAALDLALLAAMWALVVYFASRAAHVDLAGLRPAWPYLLGYLAFLGLTYAGYFTGTTGQTLGKIALGLRVVDTSGRPPGYLRAFARAGLGAFGVALAGAGLIPMWLDPARRALHDRLLRTRVVKG